MLPKKAKDLIKEQAKKEGIPKDDLWDMVNFYYHQVTLVAENLLHPRIRMHGLGILKFSHWKMKEDEAVTPDKKFDHIKAEYDKDKLAKERAERNEFSKSTVTALKLKSNKYEPKGQATEGMGAQSTDNGGVLQQVSVTKQRYRRVSEGKKEDL